MASKKISDLTTVTPVLTDLVVLDRPTIGTGAPVTGKATLADIESLIGADEYWQSTTAGQIFSTGTLGASLSGSLNALFLSSSSGLEVTGTAKFVNGLSGSLTRLIDGSSYLVAGTNVTITTASNGQVTINSSGGGGGGGNDYWQSTTSGQIFATGSLVAITGSLHAQFLSSSNGLQVTGSFTQGPGTVASANGHAQGTNTTASGNNSHAEGSSTTSNSFASHAEGYLTNASNDAAHSEGYNTTASGQYSHAEGDSSISSGYSSHAEGIYTVARGQASHTEGWGSATQVRGYSVLTVAPDGVDPTQSVFTLDSSYGDISTDLYNASNTFTSLMVTNGDPANLGDKRIYSLYNASWDLTNTHVTCSNPYAMDPNGTPITGSILASMAPLEYQLANFSSAPDQYITGTISHAEGIETISIGSGSHSEGFRTLAIGTYRDVVGNLGNDRFGSHAEGISTIAYGNYSHAEGSFTTASGDGSHAEGSSTTASGLYSHAEGGSTIASTAGSHAEGNGTTASGEHSHAEGGSTTTSGFYSHAEGESTYAGFLGYAYDALGPGTSAPYYEIRISSSYGDVTAEFPGINNQFIADYDGIYTYGGSNFDGTNTFVTGTLDSGTGASPVGVISRIGDTLPSSADKPILYAQHSEGYGTKAYGNHSHAEGYDSISVGVASHAEGYTSKSVGDYSHSEGSTTISSGSYSHAEGVGTIAEGVGSHAEGRFIPGTVVPSITPPKYVYAKGVGSHAEGHGTEAIGDYSHTEGQETIASGTYQHVQGKFNLRGNNFSLFVIGDGTADDDANRSDIIRVNSGTLPGSGSFEVTGTIRSTLGFSGSLTQLTDGTPYLIAGTGIQTSTGSSGSVTISSLPNNIVKDRSVAGNFTITIEDQFIRVSAAATGTLPNPAGSGSFVIKKTGTGNYTINVSGSYGETIDGQTYTSSGFTLSGSFASDRPAWTMWSDGTNWWIA